MKNLYAKTMLSLIAVVAVMALLLFIPAGKIRYWQAWVYLAIYIGVSLLFSTYLFRNDPALLERRIKGGPTAEKRTTQKIAMLFASLGFVALLVVPALNYRFAGSSVPLAVELAADVLVLVGFYLVFLVFRENTFASSTIGVFENQKVISTGPYALVRHPMYASAMLYVIGTPIALGSYWGLLALALMVPAIVWRLLDEEKLLGLNLPGYTEYQRKVRYRLLPGVW
ncbi:MAG TPA: isoprenylcysteine carboxylmethyltransferase family protein [Verrucomicrobiae bacterium]|jgi:protein-S-isoprenylcysteine O-methyltransferase Ste14|nr:isoprenylcysteine carboxylmethyltransferase family protein [Verrucomicrobiae bacterium]